MKGSFTFTNAEPELKKKLLQIAEGRVFETTLDGKFIFICHVNELSIENSVTGDKIKVDFGILQNTIGEQKLYTWLKEVYPNILMEYNFLGEEDLQKKEKKKK